MFICLLSSFIQFGCVYVEFYFLINIPVSYIFKNSCIPYPYLYPYSYLCNIDLNSSGCYTFPFVKWHLLKILTINLFHVK